MTPTMTPTPAAAAAPGPVMPSLLSREAWLACQVAEAANQGGLPAGVPSTLLVGAGLHEHWPAAVPAASAGPPP